MANLTVLKKLDTNDWRNAVLVVDEDTQEHYVVSTGESPWAPGYVETVAFRSDAEGSVESIDAEHHVAGGRDMDCEETLADLSARLDDNVLITADEAAEFNALKYEEQGEAFFQWLVASTTEDVAQLA